MTTRMTTNMTTNMTVSMTTRIMSIVLGMTVVLAIFCSTSFLSRTTYPFRPKLQPANGAFGIWSVIFLSAISHAVYAFFNSSDANAREESLRLQSITLLLQGIAFGLCSVWAYTFYKQQFRMSAAILVTAFLCSVASLFPDAILFSEERGMWKPFLLRRVSVGLFAGWLLVASALSSTYVFRSVLDKEWVIVLLASLSSLVSVSFRQPFVALSFLWALIFSTETLSTLPFASSMILTILSVSLSSYLCTR